MMTLGTETGTGWLGDGAAVISAVAAMVACLAAIVANRGASTMREAQTFLALDERYNTPEMGESLRILRDMWPSSAHPFSGTEWFERIERPSSADDQQRSESRKAAIRHVKSYFFNVASLIQLGGPEGTAARKAAFRYGLELFFQVVQPIEKVRQTEREPFDLILAEVVVDSGKLLQKRANLKLEHLRKWDDA